NQSRRVILRQQILQALRSQDQLRPLRLPKPKLLRTARFEVVAHGSFIPLRPTTACKISQALSEAKDLGEGRAQDLPTPRSFAALRMTIGRGRARHHSVHPSWPAPAGGRLRMTEWNPFRSKNR